MDDEKQPQWLKIFSVELLLSIVIMAFTVGGSYMALSKDIDDATKQAQRNAQNVEAQDKSIAQIKTDVAVTKAKTENIEKDLQRIEESVNKKLESIESLIREIGRE